MTAPAAPTPADPAKHATVFSTVYTWIGARTFFRWPSIVTELVFGFVLTALVAVALLFVGGWLGLLLVATALSVLYELRLDPNGWSLKDVAQRELGILVGVALFRLIL